MALIRLDPHAHLYDCYPLRDWVAAAIRNLQPSPGVQAAVVIVDRVGQDSFARLREGVPHFGEWKDLRAPNEGMIPSVMGHVLLQGDSLFIIPGVQYVTAERVEVLGIGVQRSIDDGATCEQTIEEIRAVGGVACLPWSPGKWLGARGKVVSAVAKKYHAGEIAFGDISLRSVLGPPSTLLRWARRNRFVILPGTDPLPRPADVGLVGSYGVELTSRSELGHPGWYGEGLRPLLESSHAVRIWGGPNGLLQALQRFSETLLRLPGH